MKIATLLLIAGLSAPALAAGDEPIRVVSTLPDYGWVARQVGGDRVRVDSIARGNQDAHFVRPRPSYTVMLKQADLFITTGLDLELWVPTLLDSAGNRRILEGAPGYVTAWPGIDLLDVPESVSRSQGDIHVFGNPHVHTDPLNMILVARNIAAGLKRAAPERAADFDRGLLAFEEKIHRRFFGDELVELLGGETLTRLSRSGQLWSFLESKEYPRGSGKQLVERIGGWMKRAAPLRGRRIIAYHKNWIYFATRFGIDIAGYVETKPGIPATPRHVETIINLMRAKRIRVILSSNYFDSAKPQAIAERTGGRLVTVPLSVGGENGLDDYEKLVDAWIGRLVRAFETTGDP